jgi:hypothetical protein
MFFSITSAVSCFSAISFETDFDCASTSMALSSSRMLPWDVESTCRILFSMSSSCFLFSALSSVMRVFSSASSGFSVCTTMFRSWSSSPSGVIMKFSSVTFTATSGR